MPILLTCFRVPFVTTLHAVEPLLSVAGTAEALREAGSVWAVLFFFNALFCQCFAVNPTTYKLPRRPILPFNLGEPCDESTDTDLADDVLLCLLSGMLLASEVALSGSLLFGLSSAFAEDVSHVWEEPLLPEGEGCWDSFSVTEEGNPAFSISTVYEGLRDSISISILPSSGTASKLGRLTANWGVKSELLGEGGLITVLGL